MSDVDNGGGYACVGTGGYMGNLCRKFTSQFCCKPRLLQKNEKKKNQVDGSHKLPFCFKDLLVWFVRNSLNDDEFISASRKQIIWLY